MKSGRIAAAVIGGLAVCAIEAGTPVAHAPALWDGMAPGADPVGYRRLETAGGVVHVWYPATAADTFLCVEDYLGAESGALSTFLAGTGISAVTIDSLLDSRLFAGSAGTPITRLSPLVLVAQGNGEDVFDQVVLCEYLASRGFVVATTPSPMRETPLEREDQVGELAERQASDLAAAADAVSQIVPVDTGRIGLVGHSFGARAALLLAMRDPRVRAVVSLDGGIGTATAVEELRDAPSYDASAELPPILHVYEDLDTFMTPDFTLLESLDSAELTLVPTAGMHHVHFTTYGFAAAVFPELAAATHATPETAENVVGVAVRTASFLLDRLGVDGAETSGK